MKYPTRHLTTFLGLFLLALSSGSTALAQSHAPVDMSGFWNVKFEPEPTGKALFEKIPANAVFINDAGPGELAEGDFSGLVLSDAAKAEVKAYDFESEFKLENTCKAPSAAFYMQAPFPFELHQSDKFIVLKMEYFDMVRIVFLDGREIPENAPHSKNGYSVGHWEGDELVVHTEKMSSATFMNNGFNHSDNLVMDERFKMSEDGKVLWLIQLYKDPEVFTGLAARYMAFRKQEGEFVWPYECDFSFGR